MDYPDDFDTSAFPAGKRVAVSRTMGIWSAIAFIVIICACVALPWMRRNQTINPFVIYVDSARGEWQLIGRPRGEKNIPYYQSVQRALVGIFTEKWFTVTGNTEKNARNWERCNRETECTRRVPNTFASVGGCDIYCVSGESMYQKFVTDVLPQYRAYESAGERLYIDPNKITVFPGGTITQNGGTWVARGRVYSNTNGNFDIIAYVKVAYDASRYPQTLGYYIAGFNAYRE
ncbi:MAG: hypothetical protein IJQ90_03520 [Alphaproteobacteria bacterium]|nr:hypothetical protein [Alphaproteobacteria bacterium]